MKTTIREITPQWASEILETKNPRNRRLSETFVAKLARDIKCGAFVTTHQGIAFDIEGNLLDGQHRLAAVVQAGIPITLPITTGLPTSVRVNGSTLNTFELIDGGKPRSVGAMLQMAGFPNGNKVAATVKVAVLASARATLSIGLSTGQTHKALGYFRTSVERCVAIATSGKVINPPSYITGTVALYHTTDPERAEKFLHEVADITGAPGTPSRALHIWSRHHITTGGDKMRTFAKVAASALWHNFQGNSISKLYSNEEAMEWLLSLNRPLVQRLASIVS